jgi:hypothetical protein
MAFRVWLGGQYPRDWYMWKGACQPSGEGEEYKQNAAKPKDVETDKQWEHAAMRRRAAERRALERIKDASDNVNRRLCGCPSGSRGTVDRCFNCLIHAKPPRRRRGGFVLSGWMKVCQGKASNQLGG